MHLQSISSLVTTISTFLALSVAPASAITGGQVDAGSTTRNATVYVTGGRANCTGTLIAPDIVATAGHCGFGPTNCSGHWERLRGGRTVTVSFGRDKSRPSRQIQATHINMSGSMDMVLLALSQIVPADIAIPAPPLVIGNVPAQAFSDPDQFWSDKQLRMAGWGSVSPGQNRDIRRTANLTFLDGECDGLAGVHCAISPSGANAGAGDSGGPIYWTDPTGRDWLVGVIQQGRRQNGGGARYMSMVSHMALKQHWSLGDVPNGKLVSSWSKAPIHGSARNLIARDANRRFANFAQNDVIRALTWYSSSRRDNKLTTDPRWARPPDETRVLWDEGEQYFRRPVKRVQGNQLRRFDQEGYSLVRAEGFLFDPKQPRPDRTVPLFSWWSSDRSDNFVSSQPRWSMPIDQIQWRGEHIANGPTRQGYRLYRLEGYLFDPNLPQPAGTMPLFTWWSRGRTDNFATTKISWSMRLDHIQQRDGAIVNGPTRGGYRLHRLEGYMPVMSCQGAF